MNKQLSESEVLDLLRESICEVTFKKVDGELRVMPGTLKSDVLPPKPVLLEGEVAKTRAKAPGVISVWSLDRKEWRSFRVANIVSVVKLTDSVA